MPLTVNGCSGTQYTFEGPYDNTSRLKESSGVYIIVCSNGNSHDPVDVGESARVKSRVENHDRNNCWTKNCQHTLKVAVYYTPHQQQAGRTEMEQDIRCNYNFPCGVR